jgi:hypothetical protein
MCRRRGAKGRSGNDWLFSCPYDASTYDLSGKMMGISNERCFPNVRAERASLIGSSHCYAKASSGQRE